MIEVTGGACGVRGVTTAVLWQAEVKRRAAEHGCEA
jgi:hypothetical protein